MSTYTFPDVNNRPPILSDLGFFADIQFDPNDSAPDYIGLHITRGTADTSTDWKVYKFTYSGANVTRIQLAYGAYSNRVNLF